MQYRKLGDTGLYVSELGFGTIPILKGAIPVLPKYYNLKTDEAIALLQYAWNLGCNFFDTAIVPEYGDAEIKLGMFAKTVDRNKLIVSDKARFFDGYEMYQAVEESIKNLQENPDIYFVHQVDYDNADQVFGRYGALDALTQLKKEGKIKFTGIASHYYDVLYRGLNDARVDVLQGSGNILERGMLDRIEQEPAFQRKGFVINKVYAAGLLPQYFSEKELINGVLSYPISTALIGLGTSQQITSAFLCDVSKKERLEWIEVIERLEQHFIPLGCDRCQKCYCCYGTEIHTLFRQKNYFHMGKDFWALKKLDLGIEESARACDQCTELTCMKQCPKGLFIPHLIQEINDMVHQYL